MFSILASSGLGESSQADQEYFMLVAFGAWIAFGIVYLAGVASILLLLRRFLARPHRLQKMSWGVFAILTLPGIYMISVGTWRMFTVVWNYH